jgi:hypothetical protein
MGGGHEASAAAVAAGVAAQGRCRGCPSALGTACAVQDQPAAMQVHHGNQCPQPGRAQQQVEGAADLIVQRDGMVGGRIAAEVQHQRLGEAVLAAHTRHPLDVHGWLRLELQARAAHQPHGHGVDLRPRVRKHEARQHAVDRHPSGCAGLRKVRERGILWPRLNTVACCERREPRRRRVQQPGLGPGWNGVAAAL